MDFYNVLLAKKTNRVLQYGSLYERLFETWINRARQILKDLPTGSISTVTDAAELPLNALKVSVEAVQSGSGTPSPSNIRPISGWDSGEITVCGKNLATESSGNNKVVGSVRKGYTYTFSIHNTGKIGFNLKKNNNSGDVVVSSGSASSDETISVTFTADDNYNLFVNGYGSGGITFVDNASNFQLELGNQATTYEPYQGKQYTLNFPQTIYGAEWDVTDGILKTRPYYASYNGETLVGPWISSMDEYTQGGTPTTGAQVVDMGGIETIINLSPLSIRLLEGTNNLYADCGEILSGKYWANV